MIKFEKLFNFSVVLQATSSSADSAYLRHSGLYLPCKIQVDSVFHIKTWVYPNNRLDFTSWT